MIIDLPLDELEEYKPPRTEQSDFDVFWKETLEEARAFPLNPSFESIDYGLRFVETYDVSFSGFDNQLIRAWLLLPMEREDPLPCVVEYIGYGGGRGFPVDWLFWSNFGFANLIMDTRGQGSSWLVGDTPDRNTAGTSPHVPGFLTNGITDPYNYYYRRLFTDAVRAVETARIHPAIDGERIAVTGASQGGGISLAVAGLDEHISVVMPDVPFLCHYKRATEITNEAPYSEIVAYCKTHRDKVDQVFETLSYFDAVNFSARSKADAMFSVALMDAICPPSTIFAAYNHYAGKKSIKVWEYNNHEGGQSFQHLEQVKFLHKTWL